MARMGGANNQGDDDALPWLEAADDDGDTTLVSGRKLMIGIMLLFGLLVLVVALIYAQVARPEVEEMATAPGEIALIRAPDGPFKTRPENAGGMTLDENGTVYEAADGVDPAGQIALDAMPEEPLDRPRAAADIAAGDVAVVVERTPPMAQNPQPAAAAPKPTSAEKPAPKPADPKPADPKPADTPKPEKPSKPATAEPKPATAAPKPDIPRASATPVAPKDAAPRGLALQLGAFSSSAKADRAWKDFTARYSYLSGLEKTVVSLSRDGKTLYRLRATGLTSAGQARELCGKLKVAGEQCAVAE